MHRLSPRPPSLRSSLQLRSSSRHAKSPSSSKRKESNLESFDTGKGLDYIFDSVLLATSGKGNDQQWLHKSLRSQETRLKADLKHAEKKFTRVRGPTVALERDTSDRHILDLVKENIEATDTRRGKRHPEGTGNRTSRLASSANALDSRAPSEDKVIFHAPRPDEDDQLTLDLKLDPGDFVETRRNEIACHGVVLGEEYDFDRWRLVVLMSTGEIWTPLKEDVMFIIPSIVSRDLAHRCGISIISTNRAEIVARASVLKSLRDLSREVEKTYADLVPAIRRIYDSVGQAEEWTEITLDDAVRFVVGNPSLTATLAVHKHLMSKPTQFVADILYQNNGIFHVRPQSHINTIERVTDMTREVKPLREFAARAVPIMEVNRQRRLESQSEPPHETPENRVPPWTEDDITFITFMLHSLRQVRSNQRDPYVLGQVLLLKALYSNESNVSETAIYDVLVDLGILSPWQDLVVLRPEYAERPVLDEGRSKASHVTSGRMRTGDSSRLHTSDPLDGIRHDFGNLPVYIIDDASAKELDDGISLERIPGDPDTVWIHVHIADPASVLPPQHQWSLDARKRGETMYFLQQTLPMLHQDITTAAGMGKSSDTGLPERVITFSARMDKAGDIVDYKVRAGLVRNVKVLHYDAVDEAMGFQPNEPIFTYPFGRDPRIEPIASSAKLTKEQLDELHMLASIGQQQIKKRIDKDILTVTRPRTTVSMSPHPLISTVKSPMSPVEFRGLPTLGLKVWTESSLDVGSRSIVAEMMKLAGRIASRFFRDRGIPALRRTVSPVYADSMDKILALRNERGYVNKLDTLGLGLFAPAGEYVLEPESHWNLGIPQGEGYCRVTSPLRRYLDLVGHWQIHQALLGNAAGPAIFTPNWLKDYAKHLVIEGRKLRRAVNTHERFWQLYCLKRCMERPEKQDRELDTLENLSGYVASIPIHDNNTSSYQAKLIIPTLGMEGLLQGLRKGEAELRQELPVRICEARLGTKPLLLLEKR